MSAKRIPLANNPNAANSPYRAVAGSKRPRAAANEQKDYEQGQSPAKKRQILDFNNNGTRRAHHIALQEQEGKVFTGKSEHAASTTFGKRLAAVQQSKQTHQKVGERPDKRSLTDLETIKQWKRHYKAVFPTLVFYFESMSQDVCIKSSRQISALGAREEKFFSKSVTHIVTTRPIPSSSSLGTSNDSHTSSSKLAGLQTQQNQVRTINPSLLEKSANLQLNVLQEKSRHTSEAPSQRKFQTPRQDGEVRRHPTTSADVLERAKEMGIKIWALEKFERMMSTMFSPDLAEENEDHITRHNVKATLALPKASKNTDLSQLLRNEKLSSTAERTPWQEIAPFKGFFIYIHDMDEKTKPVMIREYAKPAHNDKGEWPQFRGVSSGRCPFVEEVKKADAQVKKEEPAPPARTRSAVAAVEAAKARPSPNCSQTPVLRESDHTANRMPKPSMPAPTSRTFEAPQLRRNVSGGLDSMPALIPGSAHANFRGIARNFGGEPIASGVQPSNVTSAIRSQMISSTAAAPGVRGGTSKEIHHLQRRVLQNNSGLSANSMPSSRINDLRAAINNNNHAPAPKRTTRRKAAETMARIYEDNTQSDEENQELDLNEIKLPKEKQAPQREPKPGYCENCREKYDDFDEHIGTKKHRKFAITAENWTELDCLIHKLIRR